MLIEGLNRIGLESILGLATFWSQPGIARWSAERLGRDPNKAEEETYRVMAEKSRVIYNNYERVDFYRTKAVIAANKKPIISTPAIQGDSLCG